MKEYLRIKQGIQKIFRILFTSLLLFRLFVPWFLRGFSLMCYNQIGQQCVAPMGWSNLERLLVVTLQILVFVFLQFSFSLVGGFLVLLLYFFFLSIYLFVVSYKKKKKKYTTQKLIYVRSYILVVAHNFVNQLIHFLVLV